MGTSATKAVLIIGGSGFVGTHLAMSLRKDYKVFATTYSNRTQIPGVTNLPFDLENDDWVKRIIYLVRPDIIIYAAGCNDPSWAEDQPKTSSFVHTGSLVALTNASEIVQSKFIYLSNAYVFDGEAGNYRETDTTLASTSLGRAKIGGENFIRGRSLNYVIIRSAPLLGRGNGHNFSFLDRLRYRLDRRQRVELSTDELHTFAPVEGLVELVRRAIDTATRNKILHHGGLTKTTYAEVAQAFARRFKYDPSLVVHAPPLRRRPLDYSLNCTQAIQTLKIKPLLLEECFDLIEKKLVTRF